MPFADPLDPFLLLLLRLPVRPSFLPDLVILLVLPWFCLCLIWVYVYSYISLIPLIPFSFPLVLSLLPVLPSFLPS